MATTATITAPGPERMHATPASPAEPRAPWGLTGGAVLLLCGYLLLLVWTKSPEQFIQSFTHDDSFYYLQTARNVARGDGLTFDGRNPTNGFHPLWMLVLIPLYAAFGDDPERAVRLVLTLQILAFLLPAILLVRAAARHLWGPLGTFASLAAALWLLPSRQLNAMESGILILLGAFLLWFLARHDALSPETTLRLRLTSGILLGLAFLARTDSVFLIVAWLLVLAGRRLSQAPTRLSPKVLGRLLRDIAPVLAPVLVLALPYLAWNLRVHGHLISISGALKNSLPALVFLPSNFDTPTVLMLGLILATLPWALRSVLSRPALRATRDPSARPAILVFSLYALGHAAFTLLAMRWAVFPWHFALYALPVILIVGHAASQLAPPLPRALTAAKSWALAFLCILALAFARNAWAFRNQAENAFYVGSYRAALWARQHLPSDARIAMKDAGAFGYFSDRSVTNLDGVINNFDYQRYLARGELARYLQDQGITYLAQHASWPYPGVERGTYGSFHFGVPSRLHNRPGGTIRLFEADEIYRGRTVDSGLVTHFVIWKLDLNRKVGYRR